MKKILEGIMELLEEAYIDDSYCGSEFNKNQCEYDICAYYDACIAEEEKKKKNK